MAIDERIEETVEVLLRTAEALVRAGASRPAPRGMPAFPPMVVGVQEAHEDVVLCEDGRQRVPAARFVLERGATAAVVLYDGYVTNYDATLPCPDCLGTDATTADADCEQCRGLGGTRTGGGRRDAIVVLALRRDKKPTRIVTRSYTRAAGRVLFEAKMVAEIPVGTETFSSFAGVLDDLK